MNAILKLLKSKKNLYFALAVVGVILVAGILLLLPKPQEPEVITEVSLKEILNISELSTYMATYNGVAQVMDKAKPEKTDFYVAYRAKVKAGFDFEDVKITIDHNDKIVIIDLPEFFITECEVEKDQLEFIFIDKKANDQNAQIRAFPACIKDVAAESRQQKTILNLARENAENVVKGLVGPFLHNSSAKDYELILQ